MLERTCKSKRERQTRNLNSGESWHSYSVDSVPAIHVHGADSAHETTVVLVTSVGQTEGAINSLGVR